MTIIQFSTEEKQQIVSKVKHYFETEMDREIGGFEAEFLVDFFAREIGGYFYNRGLYDAQAVVTARVGDIADAIADIEKPVSFGSG